MWLKTHPRHPATPPIVSRSADPLSQFRTTDGRVVNIDGEEFPPEIAAGIVWPDNAPSAEDYFSARAEQDAAEAKLNEWKSYRNDVLGDIRHRYDDEDDPMTKDALREALDSVEAAGPAAHSALPDHEPAPDAPNLVPSAFPTIPMASQ